MMIGVSVGVICSYVRSGGIIAVSFAYILLLASIVVYTIVYKSSNGIRFFVGVIVFSLLTFVSIWKVSEIFNP